MSNAARRDAPPGSYVANHVARTLASRLHLGQPVDPLGYIAVRAGIGLELETDRQGPRRFAARLENLRQLVEKLMAILGGRRGGLRRLLEPFDRFVDGAAFAMEAAEDRGSCESQARRLRGRLERAGRLLEVAGLEQRHAAPEVLFAALERRPPRGIVARLD